MRKATVKYSTASPLLRLLDEELQRLAKSLPARFWEQALVGPAREFLRRSGKEFRARLVQAGWRLAGGSALGPPLELLLAVELVHAGSLIIDDVQDGAVTRRGDSALHHMVGLPLAINTGGWLYFLPLSLVERAGLDAETTAAIHLRMRQAMLACHEGQALDLAWRVTDLDQADVASVVAETTARKTASLTKAAAAMGALAAGGSPACVQGLAAFGHELGVGLQMFDDVGSLTSRDRAEKCAEDLRGARPTWPWAWVAQDCEPEAYLDLLQEARAVEAGASHEVLAGQLATRVAETGPARARAQLRHAFGRLRATCPSSPVLQQVERDFRGLDESYGV